jgi:C-terminal processing protease CtpA/Prc
MQKVMMLIVFFFSLLSVDAQPSPIAVAEKSAYRMVEATEVQQIIKVLEENICNPSWLATPEWQALAAEFQSEEMLALPLDEFQRAFNRKVKTLPFTHLFLRLINRKTTATPGKNTTPPFQLKALNAQTALLTVRAFASDGPAMAKLVQQIEAEGYENLIIDLRENTGGSLDAAVVLGQYLTAQPIDAGVYLTRKWFLKHDRYPTKAEIQQFPFLKDMTYPGIMKMFAENAAFRMVLPGHSNPIFNGRVVVLTSNTTASACEPFVDALKKLKVGTVVGEKTNGAMLSGSSFKINEDLRLFLPVADFMTDEGTRIDKVGIAPDIDVEADKALDYVLEEIF